MTPASYWTYGGLLLLGTMWGGSFSAIKVAATGGGNPIGLALWQSIGGALILAVVLVVRGLRLPLDGAHLRYYAGIGLLGLGIPSAALFSAAPHLPAGVLSMLVTTVPLMTYAMAIAIGADRLQGRRVAGVLLGFVSVALILWPLMRAPESGQLGWALIALAAPACYTAMPFAVMRLRPPRSNNLALACGMLLAAGCWQALYVLPTGSFYALAPPWTGADAALGVAAVIAGFAHFIYFTLIARSSPVFVSQVGYVVTVTGVAWGMLLFGERHQGLIWVSLAMLLCGVALVRPARAP